MNYGHGRLDAVSETYPRDPYCTKPFKATKRRLGITVEERAGALHFVKKHVDKGDQ